MRTAIAIIIAIAFIAGLWLQRRYFQSLEPYNLSHKRQQRQARSVRMRGRPRHNIVLRREERENEGKN